MKIVQRYPLRVMHGYLGYTMPIDADYLHAGYEDSEPYLWFIVDTELPEVHREFFVARTGHELPQWCSSKNRLSSISARVPGTGWVLLHVFEQTQG